MFCDLLSFVTELSLFKTVPSEKKTSTSEEQRKGNDYDYFIAAFHPLEANHTSLALMQDFFSKIKGLIEVCIMLDHLKLILVFIARASQHCDKTLRIDETFVVNVHIVVCIVDFLRGKFITVGH